MQTKLSVKNYYETLVQNYDDNSDNVVMRNGDLQRAILDSVGHFRVLDLGVGTAVTAKKILEQYPHVSVVGVDFSREMIRVARRSLSAFEGRFELVQSDIVGLSLHELGEFDVVISAITIHNIPHADKGRLFNEVYNCLTPRGIFVNGDFVEGETAAEDTATKRAYERYLKKNLTGKELQQWLTHAFEFDMPMKLSEQARLLKLAGFTSVETVWKHSREVVYVAQK